MIETSSLLEEGVMQVKAEVRSQPLTTNLLPEISLFISCTNLESKRALKAGVDWWFK